MKINYHLLPGQQLIKQKEVLNKREPIISIITPFYNDGEYIRQTANSVLNQTYPFFEWIIVDDGSTEKNSLEELEKIEKLDQRIKVFHKKNEGVSIARDYGVEKASSASRYLLFLDSDDLIISTYLECCYWTLETNKEASWAYMDTLNFGDNEFPWAKWFDSEQEKQDNLLVLTSLIRKEAFLEVGGFQLKGKALYEDWNLWLKLLQKQKYPVRIPVFGFWYRKKQSNTSELSKANNKRKELLKEIQQTAKLVTKKVKAIQYPLRKYDWDGVVEQVDTVVVPEYEKNSKINILMFAPWMTMGGADKFNLDLISKLDQSKFEITLITTEPVINTWRQKFEEQIENIYDVTTFLDRKYWASFICYIIKKNRVNLIFNTNSTFGYNVLPYLKAEFPEIPILDYIHMEEWYNRNGGFSRDSSAVASVIDKTFVCNGNSEKILIEHFGRKKEEVSTIYIGVDEKKFNIENYKPSELIEKYHLPSDKYIISFIARIDLQKRPHLLMKIIQKFCQIRQDCLFVIAGNGPMLDSVKKQAQEYGILKYIKFLGAVSNPSEIYAISDMTLNCSIKEGLALTAYESLSMGVPVVSADVGGQRELISKETGVIVPCMQKEKDIKDFKYQEKEIQPYVDGMLKILENLEYYKGNCRNRILGGFTIDQMIQNMSAIFEKVKNNPNPEKVKQGKALANSKDITKELINKYFLTHDREFIWLCEDFNLKLLNHEPDGNAYYEKMGKRQRVKAKLLRIANKIHLYHETEIAIKIIESIARFIKDFLQLLGKAVKLIGIRIANIFLKLLGKERIEYDANI